MGLFGGAAAGVGITYSRSWMVTREWSLVTFCLWISLYLYFALICLFVEQVAYVAFSCIDTTVAVQWTVATPWHWVECEEEENCWGSCKSMEALRHRIFVIVNKLFCENFSPFSPFFLEFMSSLWMSKNGKKRKRVWAIFGKCPPHLGGLARRPLCPVGNRPGLPA